MRFTDSPSKVFECMKLLRLYFPTPSEVMLRILRIEISVFEWRIKVRILLPVVLNQLIVSIANPDHAPAGIPTSAAGASFNLVP